MPKRIQLRRTKGWRKPRGTVVCTRAGKFGNPFVGVSDVVYMFKCWLFGCSKPCLYCHGKGEDDGRGQERCHRCEGNGFVPKWPKLEEQRRKIIDEWEKIRSAKYLGCFCNLSKKCHCDVYIEFIKYGWKPK